MGYHCLSLGIFSIQGSNPCPPVFYTGRHCDTWEVLLELGAGRERVEKFLLLFEIESLTSENKTGGKELLYLLKVKVAQLCLTLCYPMDSTVHGVLQARILEQVAFPFSRRFSQPRDQTPVSALQADSLPGEP